MSCERIEPAGLIRLSDDSVTEIYSFLNVVEYHNFSVSSERLLRLTKTRLEKVSPRYVQVKEKPVKISKGKGNVERHKNMVARREFAMNLRPRVLEIEGLVTKAIRLMLEQMASALESLSIERVDEVRPYFSKMTRLTTLHLGCCSSTPILEDLPASITSLSVDTDNCAANRCPLHRKFPSDDDSENSRGELQTMNGLQLAQNLVELNLPVFSQFFSVPTQFTNLTKLTFEVTGSEHSDSVMDVLVSGFPKLTTLNLLLAYDVPKHFHLLSQVSTLQKLNLSVIVSTRTNIKAVRNDISEQLRKITQLTSLHLLLPGGSVDPLSFDLESIFKHPHTLINLQELKVNPKVIKVIKFVNNDEPALANLSRQLTSFGCDGTMTLPSFHNLTHLDLSTQQLPLRWRKSNSNSNSNSATAFGIDALRKYASTIKQAIVPNYLTNDKIIQTEFVAALCACPLLREVFLPSVWKSIPAADENIRQSFVEEIYKLRPDIQLRCC